MTRAAFQQGQKHRPEQQEQCGNPQPDAQAQVEIAKGEYGNQKGHPICQCGQEAAGTPDLIGSSADQIRAVRKARC